MELLLIEVKYDQISNVGVIAGSGVERYSSVNTAAGVILVKEPDGNTSFFSDY